MNLETLVPHYAYLDANKKALDKEMKPMNEQIKAAMNELNLSVFEIDGVQAVYSVQDRSTTNEDMLLRRLQELSLFEAIEVVSRPNMKVVQDLIYAGKLPAHEIAGCVERKFVEVLTVKTTKNKK